MSSQVTKAGSKEVAQPAQQGVMETKEVGASANAQAGLNLNVFGAVAGMFKGNTKKETEADGSSTEHREEEAHVKGAGAGNLNAIASGGAEQHARQTRAAIQQNSS